MSFIVFRQVRKSYGRNVALQGVDLEVAPGAILALLGPNGAGKSTLLGTLLGTVLPDSGEVLCRGSRITPEVRTRFGYLAERVALYPQRTVRENAEYLACLKGINPRSLERSMRRVGLDGLETRKAGELSKGQLQRAGLGIALAGEAELLVLDEPFTGLDPVVLESVLETIRQEHQRGATVLISTHTISAAEAIATDVAVLLNGNLATAGSLKELRDQYPGESLESIYHRVAKSRRHRTTELSTA